MVSWCFDWACILTYIAATLACVCAVCACFAAKKLFDGLVIRVEMKQPNRDLAPGVSLGDGGEMFVDAAIATTGVITGISVQQSPPQSPAAKADSKSIGSFISSEASN